MPHRNSCPVCTGSEIIEKFFCTDNLVSKEKFLLLECRACRFIFTNDPPGENTIGQYYKSEEYISHSNTRKGLFNRLYHTVRRVMLTKKFRIILRFSGIPAGSLLDIGCGTGYFPAFMKSKGWSAIGIESDKDASEFASKNLGIDVFTLNDLETLRKEPFDAITLWHVLEHLYNPKQLIEDAFHLLKNNGILVIALPNNDSLDASLYKQDWAAWDVPRHLWHFNIDSFSKLIDGTGFSLIRTLRMPFDSFYVSILSEKASNKNFSFLRGIVTGLIAWCFSLFRKRKSSSLIYILKKVS